MAIERVVYVCPTCRAAKIEYPRRIVQCQYCRPERMTESTLREREWLRMTQQQKNEFVGTYCPISPSPGLSNDVVSVNNQLNLQPVPIMKVSEVGEPSQAEKAALAEANLQLKRERSKKRSKTIVLSSFAVILALFWLSYFLLSTSRNPNQQAEKSRPKTDAEIMQEYKESCIAPEYNDILRHPAQYEGKGIVAKGIVEEVIDENVKKHTAELLVRDSDNQYWFVNVAYTDTQTRVLSDDAVTVYGTCKGLRHYYGIWKFGQKSEDHVIPEMQMKYMDLKENH